MIKKTKYNIKNTPEVQKHKIELSDKFRFKQKIKTQKSSKPKYKDSAYFQHEQIGAESREEKTYNYLGNQDEEDILQTSGYHNSISIQEPSHNSLQTSAYDYTIGEFFSFSYNALLAHKSILWWLMRFNLLAPYSSLWSIQLCAGDARNQFSRLSVASGPDQFYFPTPTPPPSSQFQSYPGLYFPPTDSSEARNPLKNYDFVIGRYYSLLYIFISL